MKHLKRLLNMWEGLWLLPTIMFVILIVSKSLLSIWGPGVGIFPPGFLTAAFIAAFYMFVGTTVASLFIYFYHRGWFDYYYNNYKEPSKPSVKNDFYLLSPCLRVMFLPAVSFLYFLCYCYLVAQLM